VQERKWAGGKEVSKKTYENLSEAFAAAKK
jgi:hypothetical protein